MFTLIKYQIINKMFNENVKNYNYSKFSIIIFIKEKYFKFVKISVIIIIFYICFLHIYKVYKKYYITPIPK